MFSYTALLVLFFLRLSAATQFAERSNTGVSYVSGQYTEFQPGYLSGTWLLFHNTDNVTLSGTGYVRVRWEVEYWKRAGVTDDLYVDYTGTWDLVAGGGGFQYADSPAPFCNDGSGTCLNATGGSDDGYTWFTNGANHWHNEYYWLDGQVTIKTQEGTGEYNVALNTTGEMRLLVNFLCCPSTDELAEDYQTILDDINDAESGNYHVGASYDPSFGNCPCTS
ncbi:hypothetical protein Plec18167_005782 [Paecilomyces lecythidis]|uniref:Uncharacterized protein n=1 Tax=Paecilomyces lecythidis TaxID=3004212 RepID=A0ABR3XHF0_9EURO